MFITNIEDALLTVLNNYFTIPVINDYQGGPEPQGDYGVFGITTANKIHRDNDSSYSTVDGFEERIKQDYEVVTTLRFYGDSCYDNAFEAQAVLQLRSTQEDLHYNNCISVIDVTNVRRMPELRDTDYIQKASFDLNLLIGFEFIRDADYFDTVNYNSQLDEEDGNTVYTDTSTVSTTT